jgi:hypothetical protein
LRKKRLYQVPREDGGEAQAELPPDTELALPAAVAALVQAADIEANNLQQQSGVGSLTITPVNTLSNPSLIVSKVNELVEKSNEKSKPTFAKESLNSGDCVVDNNKKVLCGNKSSKKNNQEVLTKQNTTAIEMSDKQGKKSPGKGKPGSQEQLKFPKVSPMSTEAGSKSKKPEVSENTKNMEVKNVPKSRGSPKEKVISAAPENAVQSSLPGAVPETEKTREEIMAERKAKKAEKATKKGKGDKENSKPKQEVPIKAEEKKPEEKALPKPEISTGAQSSTELPPTCTPEISAPVAKTDEKSKAALKEERRLKQVT